MLHTIQMGGVGIVVLTIDSKFEQTRTRQTYQSKSMSHSSPFLSKPQSAPKFDGRRSFILKSISGVAAMALFTKTSVFASTGESRKKEKREEISTNKWINLRRQYDLPHETIQLDHGYWGVMARQVFDCYSNHQKRINFEGPSFGRLSFPREITEVRRKVARLLDVAEDEILFTRGATEALQTLIAGYQHLKPLDEIMYSDHDYDSMQHCMDWLEERRGVTVTRIQLPSPATFENILETYEHQLNKHPRVRLLLLTHVCHRNGLVLPVTEITALARSKGVDVIVDAAHSLGQVDYKISELGADFVGFSLHKWIGAPVGSGLIYIRKGKTDRIDPHFSSLKNDDHKIDRRIHTGTADFASLLTIPMALEFHQKIGTKEREDRLRYLQKIWTDELRKDSRFEVLIPKDSRLCSGMAAFRLTKQSDFGKNKLLTEKLWKHHRILTVPREGLASGSCIRVTPAPYTQPEEMESFLAALKASV